MSPSLPYRQLNLAKAAWIGRGYLPFAELPPARAAHGVENGLSTPGVVPDRSFLVAKDYRFLSLTAQPTSGWSGARNVKSEEAALEAASS